VAGGILGSLVGIFVFSWLRDLGQLDLIVSILYVFFLGTVGGLMLVESLRALRRVKKGQAGAVRRSGQHTWIHRLPFKMRFRASTIYVSIIPVLGIGFFIGLLSSVMGVGGGFIMVPALIYLLHVPTNVVVGTSLFQITFVTAVTTVLQATTNQSIDIVLAFLLMVGGVIGAQYGARAGQKLRGEQLRLLLALLVLAVGLRLAFGLFVRPDNLFSISIADI